MQPVLTVAEMQEVDRKGLESVSLDVLIGRAGRAVADAALDVLGGAYGRRVVVVAGRGNNGADGRTAAGLLARRGASVAVFDAGGTAALPCADLVIDAAYGTGFHGEYTPPRLPPDTPVLAVDIPSGVSGDTGVASGSPWSAIRTVTFVAYKPGLLQGDGAALAGDVRVADIGLPAGPSSVAVMEDADVGDLFPRRGRDGNKWTAAVLVVAGSPGMTGAATFVADAAYRSGAGMVRLGVPGAPLEELPATESVAVALPGQGWAQPALEVAERCRAVVVGPGLGRAEGTAGEVARLVAESPVPVVVDADALFALGRLAKGALAPGRSPVVLTPHDGEYARLAGAAPGPDRIAGARSLAADAGAIVLLKGATTAVADPAGRVLLGTTGSPRLATAGTGDVLSGIIGAMVSRGVPPHPAAALAAHVHGRAAGRGRPEGLVAGDLPDLVSDVLSDLVGGSPTDSTAPGRREDHRA
ncbi:MAG: NAD(P)H-hydrate dehydratase [Acidimicrobiales bacterium]|nr:NAD(P)H-hydrate dehydratase [Acidimicrobiales bacterium]